MAKEWAVSFYKSVAWLKCRDGYLKTQDYLCERCKSPAKIVHHKKYITPASINDPEVTLNWDNLEALCQDCHNREHHQDEYAMMPGVMFDEHGNLIPVLPP